MIWRKEASRSLLLAFCSVLASPSYPSPRADLSPGKLELSVFPKKNTKRGYLGRSSGSDSLMLTVVGKSTPTSFFCFIFSFVAFCLLLIWVKGAGCCLLTKKRLTHQLLSWYAEVPGGLPHILLHHSDEKREMKSCTLQMATSCLIQYNPWWKHSFGSFFVFFSFQQCSQLSSRLLC